MRFMRLDAARNRLERAERALIDLIQAEQFKDAEFAWSDFLLASNGVFAKTEQTTKPRANWKQWYASTKQFRKSDELLQYVHQARHADEHTIARITDIEPGNLTVGAPGEVVDIDLDWGPGNTPKTTRHGDEQLTIIHRAPKLILLDVINRGRLYSLPRVHKGVAIGDATPGRVAELTIAYCRELLEEASLLA